MKDKAKEHSKTDTAEVAGTGVDLRVRWRACLERIRIRIRSILSGSASLILLWFIAIFKAPYNYVATNSDSDFKNFFLKLAAADLIQLCWILTIVFVASKIYLLLKNRNS